MLLLSNDKPIWLTIADIVSIALLVFVMTTSSTLLLLRYLRSKVPYHIKLQPEPDEQNGRERFTATLLVHIDPDLCEDGVAVNLADFWLKVSALPLLYTVNLLL